MSRGAARYPGRAPIDAYGNGGFRFAEHEPSRLHPVPAERHLCLGAGDGGDIEPAALRAGAGREGQARRAAARHRARARRCPARRFGARSSRPVSRSRRWTRAPPAAPTMCCWPRGGRSAAALLARGLSRRGDMQPIIANPRASLWAGLSLLAVLVVWVGGGRRRRFGLVSSWSASSTCSAAMVWVGLVFFVNFVQLVALQTADDAGRATSCTRRSFPMSPGGSGMPRR